MTNQWYFRVGEEELGPVTFRELAELVRFGVIGERDFVRSFWKETPQRVDSVVGLLYQSRQPPPALPAQTAATATIVEHLAAIEIEERADTSERPEWLQRLLELQSSLNAAPAFSDRGSNSDETPSAQIADDDLIEDLNGSPDLENDLDASASAPSAMNSDFGDSGGSGQPSTAWDSTMNAALSHVGVDVAPPVKRGFVSRTCSSSIAGTRRVLTSRRFLSRVFRTGCMVGVSIIVFNSVQEWSTREAMRFPMRVSMRQGTPVESKPQNFPYLGRCSSTEYTLLMINTLLVSSLGAYGVAAYLESRVE